jgi:cell pole-organizing protein PopZ
MKAEPEPKLAPVSEGPRPGPLVRGLAESIAAAAAEPEVLAAPVEEPAPEPELVIETVIAEVLAEPEPIQILEQVPIDILEPAPVETFSSAPVETLAPEEPVPVEKPVPEPPYNGAQYNGAPYNGAQYNNGTQYNNGAQYNGAHYNGSAPAPAAPMTSVPAQPAAPPPSSAAKLALDALAQGLAAAASHPMTQQLSPAPAPHRADPYAQPTGTLVPVVEPDMRQYPSAAQRMPTFPPYDPHQSVRTLEDAVADMLKPMLQQWLADNMPRIIEKALRVEAASAVKRGHKPPGT